ncbi:MAG: hypothetical protein JNK85_05745 [Verrucomicrobiales bacterium]|nr:hypothetical protein [Verrucomicrobiales bacterium]
MKRISPGTAWFNPIRPALWAMILGLPSGHAYEVNTHGAISIVAARHHPESKVQEVLIGDLGQAAGLEEEGRLGFDARPRSLLEWLSIGAVNEDSYYLARFVNHFYNPINKEGLSDIALYRYQLSVTGMNALDWAWENRGSLLNQDHGWKHAREVYLASVLSPGRETRRSRLAEAFFDLGHVIHLLQDMAQPQHTRNDAHAPAGAPLFGETAPYEVFCSHQYGSPEAVLALGGPVPVPRFSRLPPSHLLNGKPPEFVAFWDTYQLARHADDVTDVYFGTGHPLGMAEISNAFFVTDDTMFTGEGETVTIFQRENARRYEFRFDNRDLQPFHRFVFPRLANMAGLTALIGNVDRTGDRALSVIRLGEPIAEGLPLAVAEQLFARGGPLALRGMNLGEACAAAYSPNEVAVLNMFVVGLRDATRKDYATQLIPRAVAYCTGLLNYFFRGRLSCSWSSSVTGEGKVRVVNSGPDPLREGSIHVMTDLGSGETQIRRLLSTVDSSAAFGDGVLEPGESFEVSVDPAMRGQPITVVFEGTLGSEVDVGVAVGRTCVPPLAAADARFRVVDLGVVPGIFENDVGNWGLNHRGAVVGWHGRFSGVPVPTGGGAVFWQDLNDDLQIQPAETQSIGVPVGQPGVRVMDINDAGVVVGVALGSDFVNRLALWVPDNEGRYPASPVLGSQAAGGLVVNGAGTVLDPLVGRLWPLGRGVVNLSEVFKQEFDPGQLRFVAAVDLDDRDRLLTIASVQEADEGGRVNWVSKFILWSPGRGKVDTGVRALGIGVLNNVGQAVLMSPKRRLVNGVELDLPNVVVWRERDGRVADLDITASGLDFNDCGVVCGYSTGVANARVWIWEEDRGIRDLAPLATLPQGVALTHALRINNQGSVLAAGLVNGQRHAYLLVP